VFVCIFYPKDHSKEASNEIGLEAIYRLMNGYSVDHASIILNYMYRVANMSRTPSLPYGKVLTHIFTPFKVTLDLKKCVTQLVPMISVHSLKTLHFYKIEPQGWQHVTDRNPTEASTLKVPLPDHPSSNISEAFVELKEDHTELRN